LRADQAKVYDDGQPAERYPGASQLSRNSKQNFGLSKTYDRNRPKALDSLNVSASLPVRKLCLWCVRPEHSFDEANFDRRNAV
jgi:hypothetical protein